MEADCRLLWILITITITMPKLPPKVTKCSRKVRITVGFIKKHPNIHRQMWKDCYLYIQGVYTAISIQHKSIVLFLYLEFLAPLINVYALYAFFWWKCFLWIQNRIFITALYFYQTYFKILFYILHSHSLSLAINF